MKFAALNKEGSESGSLATASSRRGVPTKEAQESVCLQLYHTAIKHQQRGEHVQAKDLYREILESEVLDEADQILEGGGTVNTSTILKLKYLIYKNLATIAKETGDLSAAVDAYIQASSVDVTDITMWCQLSSAACGLGKLLLAKIALEQALRCNDRYWPAIDSLCTVTFALGDYGACLHTVSQGLKMDPCFPRGLAFLHHMFREQSDFVTPFADLRIHLMKPWQPEYEKYLKEAVELERRKDCLGQVTFLEEPVTPPKKLTYLSLYALGECLVAIYMHCKELSKTKPSFAVKVDLSTITEGCYSREAALLGSQSPIKRPTPVVRVSKDFSSDGTCSSGDEVGEGRREAKRKPTDLELPYPPKRRSRRVHGRYKKKEERIDYFEMFGAYIPPWLKFIAMPDISELSPLKKPQQSTLPESVMTERQKRVEAVVERTVRLRDVETVQKFLEENQVNCGIINLLYKYILFLATNYSHKWAITTFPNVRIFLEAYKLLHPHLSYPCPLGTLSEADLVYLRQLAMIALCYVELYVDCEYGKVTPPNSKKPDVASLSSLSPPPNSFLECYTFVQQCVRQVGDSQAVVTFALRVTWCQVKWRFLQGDSEGASLALKRCKELILEAESDFDVTGSGSSAAVDGGGSGVSASMEGGSGSSAATETGTGSTATIEGGAGSTATMEGGAGSTTIIEGGARSTTTMEGGAGSTATMEGGAGSDAIMEIEPATNVITKAEPGSDAITVAGSGSSSTMEAGPSSDVIMKAEPGSSTCTAAAAANPLVIYLCNCTSDQIISLYHTEEKVKMLEQSLSLEQIYQLYEKGEHSTVAKRLLPVIGQETGTFMEFLLGGDKVGDTGLSMLLHSLLKLNRTEEFIESATQALLELLHHYKMGNELWVAALWNTYSLLDRCLSERMEECLGCCDDRVLRRLIVCVLKTVELVYDMYLQDSPSLLCMPICFPWKLFHIIIASNWKAASCVRKDLSFSLEESMEVESTPPNMEPESTPPATSPSPPGAIKPSDWLPESTRLPDPGSGATTPRAHSVSPEGSGQLTPELRFLKEAHSHLGTMGWCCKDDGCLLLSSVQTLRRELRILKAHSPKDREVLLQELEQCYYCLYGHPHRKTKVLARGLVEHGAEQVALTWDAALILIEYFRPSYLPSIDDVKSTQVTFELLALYERITKEIPDVGKVVSMEALNGYIDGGLMSLPAPQPAHQYSSVISEIYYLLADDALKSNDNHKALRYYLQNLCYCPDRFDSWAGLALARSRNVIERVNKRDIHSLGLEKYVQKQTNPTVRCFKKAISLNGKHCYIREKFGFFCYLVQSYASQVTCQPHLFTSRESCDWAIRARRDMLVSAETCFLQSLTLEGTKHAEPWIYSLMLGKIRYKLERPVTQTLQHLLTSALTLYRDGARYPEHVEINAKGHAMEAVEVQYQLHACALKYLTREKLAAEDLSGVREVLTQAQNLPWGNVTYPSLWEWAEDLVNPDLRGTREARLLPTQQPSLCITPVVMPTFVSPSQASVRSSASLFSPATPSLCHASPSPPSPPLDQPSPRHSTTPPSTHPQSLQQTAALPPPPSLSPNLMEPSLSRQTGLTASPVVTPTSTLNPPSNQILCRDIEDGADILPSGHVQEEMDTGIDQLVSIAAPSHPPVETPPTTLLLPPQPPTQPPPTSASLLPPHPPMQTPPTTALLLPPHPSMQTPPTTALLLPPHPPSEPPPTTALLLPPHPLTETPPTTASLLPSQPPSQPGADTDTSMELFGEPEVEEEATDKDTMASVTESTGTPTTGTPPEGSLTPVAEALRPSLETQLDMIQQCVYSIAVCAVRCPAYFKPPYRLASYCLRKGQAKVAKQLLLGPLPPPLLDLQDKLQPLFVLKANIFTNMWQIPANEINRPGNFSTHARRNLELLVEVLATFKEIRSLISLAQQLKNRPDQSKQYMRDIEREAVFKEVVKRTVSMVELLSRDSSSLSCESLAKLMVDAYVTRGLATRIQGQALTKPVDGALDDLYKLYCSRVPQTYTEGSSPDAQLEAAVRFCQHRQKNS